MPEPGVPLDGRTPATERRKQPLTIAQVGRRCTALALVMSFMGGAVSLTVSYPPTYPGADSTAESILTIIDMLGVGTALSLGLCVAAPRMQAVVNHGLRTASGGFLTAIILVTQLAIGGLLLAGLIFSSGINPDDQWQRLAYTTLLPGLPASAIAMAMFDRFAVPRRAARSHGVLRAAAVATLVGTAICNVAERFVFGVLGREYHWYSDTGSFAVLTCLFFGLCIVASLVPQTWERGLSRPAGAVLMAGVLASEFIFVGATSKRHHIAIDFSGSDPWALLAAFVATAIAFVIFGRLAVSVRRREA